MSPPERTPHETLHAAAVGPGTPTMRELGEFMANDLSSVANAFERWDSFPIFSFSSALVAKLRASDGRTGDIHRIAFEAGGRPCELDVVPALVLDASGTKQSVHYPGATEELVLEILYKIAAEAGYGFQKDGAVGVLFSYAMLRRQLAAHGHRRNHPQVVLAIQVLQGTRIVVREKGVSEPIYLGSILPQVFPARVRSSHAQEKLFIAELPAPVAEAIESLGYRQCSYSRVMAFRAPLAKWIYKRMVARWLQASRVNDYHFSTRTLESSGWLQHSKPFRRRARVIEALDELVERDVITRYDVRHTHGGRAGRDITGSTYTVFATQTFCTEQKAANGRAKAARIRLESGGRMDDSFELASMSRDIHPRASTRSRSRLTGR